MTMLVSLFSSSGIVFAADRALVSQRAGRTAAHPWGDRSKLVEVPSLGTGNRGVVGYFGLAQLGGQPMDDWLERVVADWDGSDEIEDFGVYLRDGLNAAQLDPAETSKPSGFHVGGFVIREGIVVPAFCFVRNCFDLDPNLGEWGVVLDAWHCHEQFVARMLRNGVRPAEIRDVLGQRELETGFPFWYRNGDLPFFSHPFNALADAIQGLVRYPAFSGPDSTEGWEEIARAFVSASGALYRSYYRRGAPTVGEVADTVAIPWP